MELTADASIAGDFHPTDNFRSRFCQVFHRTNEFFESSLFWRGLSPLALPVAALLFPFRHHLFAEEIEVIRDLGHAEDREGYLAELRHYLATRRTQPNSVKRLLGLRLSGRRLIAVAERVFKNS